MPTIVPTVEATVGAFDWNIMADPNIGVSFDDANSESELKFKYTVDDKNVIATIYEIDCVTIADVNPESISATVMGTPLPGKLKDVDVIVDIDQTTITSSDYFSTDGTFDETSKVEFCLRLDLTMEDGTTSINFHETKTTIDIDMTNDFEIIGVTTNRTAATETAKNTTLDYSIQAYQCLSDGSADATVKTQGASVGVCVETNATGLDVVSITEMDLHQDDFTFAAIDNAKVSPMTSSNCVGVSGTDCYTQVMLISEFFDKANPSAIIINGTCVLGFQGARRLSSVRGGGAAGGDRSLQEEVAGDVVDQFAVQVPLQGTSDMEGAYDGGDELAVDSAAVGYTGLFFTTMTTAISTFVFGSMLLF